MLIRPDFNINLIYKVGEKCLGINIQYAHSLIGLTSLGVFMRKIKDYKLRLAESVETANIDVHIYIVGAGVLKECDFIASANQCHGSKNPFDSFYKIWWTLKDTAAWNLRGQGLTA